MCGCGFTVKTADQKIIAICNPPGINKVPCALAQNSKHESDSNHAAGGRRRLLQLSVYVYIMRQCVTSCLKYHSRAAVFPHCAKRVSKIILNVPLFVTMFSLPKYKKPIPALKLKIKERSFARSNLLDNMSFCSKTHEGINECE
jgi:hypothetical protein